MGGTIGRMTERNNYIRKMQGQNQGTAGRLVYPSDAFNRTFYLIDGKYEFVDPEAATKATKRLLKELNNLQTSTLLREGILEVEVVNDNLYEWNIWLKKVDEDSPLQYDLTRFVEIYGSGILFNINFSHNYPFSPPFIRVVEPFLSCPCVSVGGAVCCELLTADGWTISYTIESVMVQLAAMLSLECRIMFGVETGGCYTLKKARKTYEDCVLAVLEEHEEDLL